MADVAWRSGMAIRCPVCYGMDLSYAEDGWGTCKTCGARSAPTWAAPGGPTPVEGEAPPLAERTESAVGWGRALLLGTGAAILGGLLWGFCIWYRGYLLGAVAIPIALLVAWSLEKGAGRIPARLPILGAGLTVAAILFGELVFLMILFSDAALGDLDLVRDYAGNLTSVQTVPSYVFGGVGAIVSAAYLRDRQKAQERRVRRAEAKRSADRPRPE